LTSGGSTGVTVARGALNLSRTERAVILKEKLRYYKWLLFVIIPFIVVVAVICDSQVNFALFPKYGFTARSRLISLPSVTDDGSIMEGHLSIATFSNAVLSVKTELSGQGFSSYPWKNMDGTKGTTFFSDRKKIEIKIYPSKPSNLFGGTVIEEYIPSTTFNLLQIKYNFYSR
jgi:hypothetical protein